MEFLYFAVFNYLNWYFVRYFIPFVKFHFILEQIFILNVRADFVFTNLLYITKQMTCSLSYLYFFYQVILKLCYNV